MATTATISIGAGPAPSRRLERDARAVGHHTPLFACRHRGDPRATRVGDHQVVPAADGRGGGAHQEPDAKLRLGRNRRALLGRLRYGERRPLRGSLGRGLFGRRLRNAAGQGGESTDERQRRGREEAALSRGSCQT